MRAPSSIGPTLLTQPGLTVARCVPGPPAGPDTLQDMPARFRFPACPELGDQIGLRRTKGFLSPEPPRAQGGDKKAPAPPVITSRSRDIADRNADPGLTGASTRCVARGAARKSPTFRGSLLGRYAVRPPTTPRPEIRDPSHCGTTAQYPRAYRPRTQGRCCPN